MKVTFHQLEVFECVARRLSFTRAAEELSLSQPTVSAQIRQLTEEVGMPLFEQIGKAVSLTDAGRELLGASRGVFDTWSRFEMTIADMRGLKRGRLKIGCTTTAKYFVPAMLGSFCILYPEVDVRLEIANREALIDRLRNNIDDLYIMMLPPDDIDIEKTSFLDNPLVMIATESHPLAARRAIPLSRMKEERFILRETGSGTRIRAASFFASHEFTPRARMELGSNEAIKHAVCAGLGVSVLSRHALDADLAHDGLVVLDVVGFPLSDAWFLVYPRGKRLSVVARTFHDYVLAEAARSLSLVREPAPVQRKRAHAGG